ncbi:TetR/AcrR family transcriptional regulator [Kineosporia babensis]|uniref:TetR/AcrR family transcriptional regulator n=1 Tax=Kineosporia babensis TaxID=499548 RepID=A0A9X1NP34_9ACTN|nr:TetR/AcrR family transcriptional regulator [Kineosporia babensis]MCD5316623.1 TetR/AcrR family transcriptional regulator [Kineosporia babensis]
MSLRERKKLEAWRSIRAAAATLFEAHGYEAVSVEEIAAAANVSRATFFNYFHSKEAVVTAQDPQDLDEWLDLLKARPETEQLWDSLSEILLGVAETLRDWLPTRRRIQRAAPSLEATRFDIGHQFFDQLLVWAAGRAADGGQATAVLQCHLALATNVAAYRLWGDTEDFDDYVDRLREQLAYARPAAAITSSTAS